VFEAAVEALSCGVNDLGGTLLEEHITRSAGGRHGVAMRPEDLADAIRRAGRVPVRRRTLYHFLDAPAPSG